MNKKEKYKCRCCFNMAEFYFQKKIFDQIVNYYDCSNCGYVQTEYPYWLEKAYERPINISDTGILSRNILNEKIVLIILLVTGGLKKKVLDCAGGYGILVRLLKDKNIDILWSDKYCSNIFCFGAEFKNEDNFHLVTSFESFEHFINPTFELNNFFKLGSNLLISTETFQNIYSNSEWWYFGLEHGQHIGFARYKTMNYLANKYNKKYYSYGSSYHLFTDKKISGVWLKLLIKLRYLIYPLIIFLMRKK